MALKSMTGFARSDGSMGPVSWHWELRSVNGRGLDIRLRLPGGYEALEQRVRDACKGYLARGNCTANLSVAHESGETRVALNEDVFRQVAAAAKRASAMIDAEPPSIDSLLTIRGVMEFAEDEPDEEAFEKRLDAMLVSLEAALRDIAAVRAAEGERLARVIAGQIDEIETLTGRIEAAPARTPEAIAARLREQIGRLLEDSSRFDEQRLHQEAVLIAAKADVQEEIERLKVHIAAARDLLAGEEPAGRRLEFLAQEFNRESNTICSKSNDTEISQAGLALKAVIDQLREQVQNIE
jgi:uncharacterized protein (TIGR00255 family)